MFFGKRYTTVFTDFIKMHDCTMPKRVGSKFKTVYNFGQQRRRPETGNFRSISQENDSLSVTATSIERALPSTSVPVQAVLGNSVPSTSTSSAKSDVVVVAYWHKTEYF